MFFLKTSFFKISMMFLSLQLKFVCPCVLWDN